MTSRKSSNNQSRIRCLPLFFSLLATAALSVSALAQSQEFPTYQVGANANGSQGPSYGVTLPTPWVVSSGQIITPAGTQVYLGIRTRAKAIALNPNSNTHTAAVLQMGEQQSVTIFNTQTGAVLQNYNPPLGNNSGSSVGITYSANGLQLLFSQDGYYGPAYVAIANVDPNTGLLTNNAQVGVSLDVNESGYLTTVDCFPYNAATTPPSGSPPGTTGSIEIPCGQTVSLVSEWCTHCLSDRHRPLAEWQDRLRGAGQQRHTHQHRPDAGETGRGSGDPRR
jgi:hypothetical protein